MATEQKTISYTLHGPTITKLARDETYQKGRLNWAIQLLTSCLQTDQLTELQIEHMAMDILNGKAEIIGTYPGDDYNIHYLKTPDKNYNLCNLLESLFSQIQKEKDKRKNVEERFAYLQEKLTESEKREYQAEYHDDFDELLFPDLPLHQDIPSFANTMLQSFMERMRDKNTDDYGWLEPNGTFHPVEFGEHEGWAETYIRKNCSNEEWLAAGIHQPGQFKSSILHTFGDYLVEHGWVLLDNPHQGIAIITSNPTKRMTKAQKEFLYDYYIKRNQTEKANAIWSD